MVAKALAVGLCLVLASACSSEPEDTPSAPATGTTPAASGTPGPDGTASPTAEDTTPGARTLDLRYRVRPRSSKLFQVNLPPQTPGGTLVTWSAYLQGVGTVASAAEPLKAECYVVQSTGEAFEDRVLYVADDSSVSTGFDISLSGSGVVDAAEGAELVFECELDENGPGRIPGLRWQTHPQQPIQVTLTPTAGYEQRQVTIR